MSHPATPPEAATACGDGSFSMMRAPVVLLSLSWVFGSLSAETPAPNPPAAVAAEVAAAARHDALGRMLAERESPETFERAVGEARAAGVGEQAILEARFLFHVDRRDDRAIAAMLPAILERRACFRIEDSAIFATSDDWLAVVEYVQAVAALGKGDKNSFKKHITEAFWLSPSQAAAFAPHIERLRLDEAMAGVTIDFSTRPGILTGGNPTTIAGLMEGRKALLLHFWSPWSRECGEAMPDFVNTARMLSDKGFAVLSLVPDEPPGLLDEAREMIQPHAGKACGAWLIDPGQESLARLLRVRSLPTMVIASAEGAVLYNGDPSDERFWDALRKIDGTIARPAAADDEHR
jgi:hypothetical protein